MAIKNKDFLNLFNLKYFITLGLAYTISVLPVYSQQIVPDGYTQTNLDINGKTTSVSTGTIKGVNAFNSFSKFDVYQGNTVNLIVPGQSSNLINIIKSQATNIDGVLNSIKNNQIGGNVFLVNPHGIFIGKQGVVNVGSLTAITPTKTFTDTFFDSPGNPNDSAVNVLLNGKAPLNSEANVSVAGQIKAIEKVKIDTGTLTNSGTIQISDIVNTDNLKNATTREIVIQTSKDIVNTGNVIADGNNNLNAGNIDIDAANNIQLASNSLLSAKGVGESSNAGNINILAQNNALFDKGAVIDVSGGNKSGNGGFVELSARKAVQLAGEFKAAANNGIGGSILVDPPTLDIKTNQYSNGANMSFQADNSLTVANGIILSSRKIANYSTANHATAVSTGNSGNITLSSNNILLGADSKLYAQADSGYTPGSITLLGTNANATIKLGGLVYTNGTVQYTSAGSITNATYSSGASTVGGVLNLRANNGAVGSADSYLLVNLYDSVSGSINAQATGNVYLKSTKDMRIGQITGSGSSDVYLTTSGKILDALNGTGTNVTARNLFIQMLMNSKNYYFIGINGDAKAEKNAGLMTYYLNTLKNKGQNWLKMSSSNFKIFDDSVSAFTQNDVLTALSNFANKMTSNDVLLIVYNGHGYGGDPNPQFGEDGLYNGYDGTPVDEAVAGSKALNGADEGLSFNNIYISDDEFADSLKNTKGTIVYYTGQCYGGGMFGGTYDLDQVAQRNGFSYFGVTGNIEGKMAWGNPYTKYSQNYNFVANLHSALLDTLTETSPVMDTMNYNATSMYDWHNVNLTRAYNANGNVYLNEWYNGINKENYYAAYQKNATSFYTYHYPYNFVNFTNMTATQLQNTPILCKTYEPTVASLVDSIGSSTLPLRVNLAGNLQVAANNAVNVAGNVVGTTQIVSNQGAVNLSGVFTGNITSTGNADVNITGTTGALSIDKITANNSNVKLVSAGNILNASTTNSVNIIGKGVNLQSQTGTVGTDVKAFTVSQTGGNLSASAGGTINIQGLSGNMNLDTITNAGKGSVILKSAGSILNATKTTNPNIYGKDVSLDAATAGSIGLFDIPLNIYSNYNTTGGKVTAMAQGYINLNQTAGNLYVNAISNAGRSDMKVISGGGIFDFNNSNLANILSKNIYVYAKGEAIGTTTNPLNIDSSYNNTYGLLTAFGSGYMNLREVSGSLGVNVVSNAGRNDVKLTSNTAILNGAGGTAPNIYAKSVNLTSTNSTIGISTTPLILYTNYSTTGGSLTSSSLDLTNVTQYFGNLYINSATSTNNDIFINSDGSILNGNGAQNAVNISARNIKMITVTSGSIGLYNLPFGINLNGGNISAQAFGYINLNQPNGNMNVNLISNAGRYDVKVNVANGNILNPNTNGLTNIYCRGLNINSTAGTVGSSSKPLIIDSNYNNTGGTLTATANGYIYLSEYAGNMSLNVVSNAGRATAALVATGNILDGSGNTNPKIYARCISLYSVQGSIGTASNPLRIYQNYNTTGGHLSAFAPYSIINITQPTGDLTINSVTAGSTLTLVSAGNIYNSRTDKLANLQGYNINLTSQNGSLGTQANPHYAHASTGVVNTWAKLWVYVNKI